MKDTPYSLRFQWMLESEDPAFAYRAKDGDIEAKSLHFPPELGEGCFRVFGLALGMTLIQSEHRMTPAEMARERGATAEREAITAATASAFGSDGILRPTGDGTTAASLNRAPKGRTQRGKKRR